MSREIPATICGAQLGKDRVNMFQSKHCLHVLNKMMFPVST